MALDTTCVRLMADRASWVSDFAVIIHFLREPANYLKQLLSDAHTMDTSLTLTIASSQILAVTLSDALQARIVIEVASAMAAAQAAEEVKCRTYHMGSKPTPDRGYDDRLTKRTGIGETKLNQLLKLGPVKGGLRRVRAGDKWLVTETAVREWLGDLP